MSKTKKARNNKKVKKHNYNRKKYNHPLTCVHICGRERETVALEQYDIIILCSHLIICIFENKETILILLQQ